MLRCLLQSAVICAAVLLPGCSPYATAQSAAPVIEKGTIRSAVNTPDETAGWKKVWSDEFDGNQIDPAKWDFDRDCWGGGNEERQCYTSDRKNAAVRDGKLVITALQEEAVGPAYPDYQPRSAAERAAKATKPFSSARLVTRGKAAWTYGWIEVRAKLPKGQGTWPAIWMLPEDDRYGRWAASGEIDILEAVNLGVECKECPGAIENTILGTLHFGGQWPDNTFASTEIAQPGSLEEFHTYSIIWSAGKITWLIDGRIFAIKTAEDWSTTATDDPNAPFDQPFHLILNLAIGGKLAEGRGIGGVSEDGFPKEYEIDWVRVWQCDTDIAKAKACPIEGD